MKYFYSTFHLLQIKMKEVDDRKKFAFIKTNDCIQTKPEECEWKLRTEDNLDNENWNEGIKIECGCT